MATFSLKDGSTLSLAQSTHTTEIGAFYDIDAPADFSRAQATIFSEAALEVELEEKYQYLMTHPLQTSTPAFKRLILWPESLIYKEGQLVGVIHQRFKGILLNQLLETTPSSSAMIYHDHFAFDFDGAMNRLKLASSLTRIVAMINETKVYDYGKVLAEDFGINTRGEAVLISLDQVGIERKERRVDENRFSLASLLFELLLGATSESLSSIKEHPHLKLYPQSIQDALISFTTGKTHLLSAAEWSYILDLKPEIIQFKARQQSATTNGVSVQLQWKVKHAQEVTINNGIGKVEGNSIEIEISKPTVFYLTATNAFGSVRSLPVEVSRSAINYPQKKYPPAPQAHISAPTQWPITPSRIPAPPNVNIHIPKISATNGALKNYLEDLRFQVAPRPARGIKHLQENYKWTKTLLDQSTYRPSFEEYLKFKIYEQIENIKSFFRKAKSRKH